MLVWSGERVFLNTEDTEIGEQTEGAEMESRIHNL